MIDKKY